MGLPIELERGEVNPFREARGTAAWKDTQAVEGLYFRGKRSDLPTGIARRK
jgi:hypothetical protein